MPKFTIVIATYNSAQYLRECLDSIFSQTFSDYEVVVKDGGSDDDTLLILSEYENRYAHKLVTIKGHDNGVYHAWNIALEHCHGQWVTFLGSDDYFYSNGLLEYVNQLVNSSNKDIGLFYFKNNIINECGEQKAIVGSSWRLAQKKLDKEMSIRHPGSFVLQQEISNVEGFDENYKIIGDYDLTLKLAKNTTFAFGDYISVSHRIGGLSICPSRMKDVLRETVYLHRKHNHSYLNLITKLNFKRCVLYFLTLFLSDNSILKIMGRK